MSQCDQSDQRPPLDPMLQSIVSLVVAVKLDAAALVDVIVEAVVMMDVQERAQTLSGLATLHGTLSQTISDLRAALEQRLAMEQQHDQPEQSPSPDSHRWN